MIEVTTGSEKAPTDGAVTAGLVTSFESVTVRVGLNVPVVCTVHFTESVVVPAHPELGRLLHV
jgi:hypothetical protein